MRIEQIQETFIVAEKNDEVIGYINGPVIKERYISDDLFKMSPQIIVKVVILVC
ncbi:acetyltransferase (GNAT) family protein [Staphylococcus aureus]|uniref:Acetyltransferase (GNAT) family protein n=1 Tax=Staphylococcus aureus TaxID=1280 RepID=A0A380DZV3_STAAU|nr:acetyltransferase (GNAT) family protein [Staphylococcus aureus]